MARLSWGTVPTLQLACRGSVEILFLSCHMQVVVALDAAAVPLLEGAAECASGGYLSSLHPENARAAAVVEGGLDGLRAGLLALLVDPQTGQWCACSSSARLCVA